MILLHPWLLAFAPLAALPVLVHLFLRLRRTSLPFSSLMFFLKVDPQAHARRRLRELLLLALRVLLLLLALLALARPQLTGIGRGGPAAVVLVVDTSASMGAAAADGGSGAAARTRLALARDGAAALIDALGAGDRAALVPTVVDPASGVSAGLGADRAALRAALDRLAPSEAASDVPRAVARAAAILAEGGGARRELHVFTDAQAGEWAQPGTIPEGIAVTVHRVAPAPRNAPDVAIRAVQPPVHRVLAGRPARTTVVLVNHDGAEATVALRIAESDGPERLVQATVPARGETTVPVVLTPTAPGPCTATVRLSGDGFAGDDGSGIALWAEARAPALLLGGAQGGLLATALSPEGDGSRSGLAPTPLAWGGLDAALATRPAVLVATWDDLPAAGAPTVRAWVASGGRLIVLPAPAGLGDPPPAWAWLGVAPGALQDAPEGRPLAVLAPTARAWSDLRGAAGAVKVAEVRARRWRPLAPVAAGAPTQAVPLGPLVAAYGLADGTPLLVERQVGAGTVAAFGVAFHPSWSDLPLKGWSLALLHALALPPADDGKVIRLLAGQPFPPSTSTAVTQLRGVGGAAIWSGPRRDLPPPARSGAFLLDGVPVAVTAAAGEGAERYADAGPLAALGGGPQRVLALSDPRAVAAAWRDGDRGTDLTPWLIVLALVVLGIEGWIATGVILPQGRAAQAPSSGGQAGGPFTGGGPTPARAGAPAVLAWSPLAPEPLVVLALLAVVALLALHHRRLRQRLDQRAALLHLLPRAAVALILLLALLGPTLRFERAAEVHGTVLALVDTSSSMDVVDDGHASRLTRARAVAAQLGKALPSGVELRTLAFDTRVRGELSKEKVPAETERPGDPAAVLRTLGGEPAARGVLAVLALTDGGDEPFTVSAPPAAPLSLVGIGGDPATWRNLAVDDVQAPATAEVKLETVITATLTSHVPGAGGGPARVPVRLELYEGGRWSPLGDTSADLSGGRAQVEFRRTHDRAGLLRYRVVAEAMPGEVAVSDNTREFTIDVRAQTLHVLFFTRELGADYKALRQELARDPGLTFTGLLRTTVSAAGERYLLQGDRLEGDAALEGGLPTDPARLARYGVVILGAFPASAWRPGEQEALVAWTRQGGTLVLLGGEQAFSAGGYSGTPLSGILPFSGDEGFVRGSFPVAVPPAATHHPVVAGVAEQLPPGAAVDSRNRLGPPTPAATVLLTAGDGGRSVPLVLSQPVGQGTVVAVATNTLWRIARPGAVSAFATLWRQLVRQQGGGDRERRVRVAWDRERYRPGDTAVATITALEPGAVPRATLRQGDGAPAAVAIDAQGRAALDLVERGEWTFRVTLGDEEGAPGAAYSKTLVVAPTAGEGTRLVVDDDSLRAAAAVGGGSYGREAEAGAVIAALVHRLGGAAERVERGLLDGWWTLVLVAALLTTEWVMRRRRNWI